MKSLFLAVIALILCVKTYSQEEDEIRIEAGHSINEYFTRSQRFRYDQFKDGKIYYESGRLSQVHKFNYDLVNGRMLVIQMGDTVPIVPIDQKIKYYKIENEIYLNIDKNEIVEVLTSDSIMLGMSVKYIIKRTERVGNNGYSSGYDPTGATSGRSSLQDVILVKSFVYYLIEKNDKVYHANRSKILKAFPSRKEEVTKYLEAQKTNFKSRSDLEQLVAYLNSIVKKAN